MILTCPACGTQYVVKDGAIPEGGRKVRCASCRHSWHQDPEPVPTLVLEEPLEEAPPIDEPVAVHGSELEADHLERGDGPDEVAPVEEANTPPVTEVEPTTSEPASAFVSPPPASERYESPYEQDDDFSPFADRGPVERPRRGPLVPILLVVIVVAALAAAFWFLAPPEWKARLGITGAGSTPLQLMMTHSDRQALESGNELLAVSGRVINPTTKAQSVPPIQAELRSKTGQVVYRWTIAPPTRTLAPGASAPFNSAEVNVPAGGEELTVSLGPPGA